MPWLKSQLSKDDDIYLNQLKTFIGKYQLGNKMAIDLRFYQKVNAVLDIALNDNINGKDIALKFVKRITKSLSLWRLWFQYAVNGYEVDALGYMVKLIAYFPFPQEVKKASEKIDKGKDILISVSNEGEFAIIHLCWSEKSCVVINATW